MHRYWLPCVVWVGSSVTSFDSSLDDVIAIPCNLPELQKESDVLWIYEKLLVGLSDEEAALRFREVMERCLNTLGTRINDMIHMWAHA